MSQRLNEVVVVIVPQGYPSSGARGADCWLRFAGICPSLLAGASVSYLSPGCEIEVTAWPARPTGGNNTPEFRPLTCRLFNTQSYMYMMRYRQALSQFQHMIMY